MCDRRRIKCVSMHCADSTRCHAPNGDAASLPVSAVDHPGGAPPAHLPGISGRLRRSLRFLHPPRGAAPLGGDAALAAPSPPAVLPALLRLQRPVALPPG